MDHDNKTGMGLTMSTIRRDKPTPPTPTQAQPKAGAPEMGEAAADWLVSRLAADPGAGGTVVNVAGAIGSVKAGDAYGTALAARDVMTRVAPTLSKTVVGVGLDAVVLTSGVRRLGQKQANVEKGFEQLAKPSQNRWQGLYTISFAGQQWALMGRALVNALERLTTWTLKGLSRVPWVGPFALVGLQQIAQVSRSPVGQLLKQLNRWIPLLNVAFVVLAGRTAVQVCRDPNSSAGTKALAIASVGMGIGVVAGGFLLTGWNLIGLIVASLVLDAFLANGRAQDRRRADAEALAKKGLKDPHQGFNVAKQLAVATTSHVQENVQEAVTRLLDKDPATPAAKPAPVVKTAGAQPAQLAEPSRNSRRSDADRPRPQSTR